MEQIFQPLKLGNRTISVRNWKVRDRLKLKESLKNTSNETKQQEITLDILVYGCLEKPVALNEDELEYLFTMLRVNSIGDEVKFKFTCPNTDCNAENEIKLKPSKIYKPSFKELKNIKVPGIDIELQEVRNVEYYNSKIKTSTSPSLTDLILHIKTINGEMKSEEMINRIFEELDTKVMDEILDKWDEMRFTISRENKLKCPVCNAEEEFYFDEIPNLIPEKWFRR